jgi:hypothetical protein
MTLPSIVPNTSTIETQALPTAVSTEVHEVIQVEETGQVSRVTPAIAGSKQASVVTSTTKVGGDPTAVMEVEVELMTC